MKKHKNTRSLDEIADDYQKLERTNTFGRGELLEEAQAQCEHGEWQERLETGFGVSWNTADRLIKVSRLGAKFPKLKTLRLGKTPSMSWPTASPKRICPRLSRS